MYIIDNKFKKGEIAFSNYRSLTKLLFIGFISVINASCSSDQNFQGHLESFVDDAEEIDISYNTNEVDDVYSPYVDVLDSFAIFYSTKENKAFGTVQLNMHSRNKFFCPLGHGHNEYTALSPITQVYEDMGDKKTLLFAPNESKLLIWNISESIRKNTTIYEHVVPYSWKGDVKVAFTNQVIIGKDSVLLYIPSLRINNQLTKPKYQIRTLESNRLIRDICIFDHPIDNKTSKVLPENYFGAFFSLKPDKSMFVEAMTWLPQINIVDIRNGKISGHRMAGAQGEDVFLTTMEDVLCCYTRVVSDNDYIYGLWSGTPLKELRSSTGSKLIHVFDWKGKLTKKIRLKEPINELSLDIQTGNLYGWNIERQKLYKYDLSSLRR